MIDARVQTDVRSAPVLPLTTRLGPVHLAVTSRERALAIWRDVVGLDLVEEDANALHLGVNQTVLIVLETGATAPVKPRSVGLYHVAIHVPARRDLAQFVVRALQARVRISPTDHLVSEAVYLSDFDDNGIEMTFETPWRGHLSHPDTGTYATTVDGRPHSGRDPIDLDDLLGELGQNPAIDARLPQGARIGHVHLHVQSLDDAMTFYRDVLGFGGLFLIQSFGMGDVGLNYMPHTLAFNIWSGPDAALPPPGAAGLRWFTIVVPDAATLEAVRSRLLQADAPLLELPEGIETADPSGNRLRILQSKGQGVI